METGKPRVGEVVRVVDGSILHGKEYLVVACPNQKLDQYSYKDDGWWVVPVEGNRDHEDAGFISVGTQYEVVSSSSVARTSVVSDDVDAKLKHRRDVNLSNWFWS